MSNSENTIPGKCLNCGHQLKRDDHYCPNCGQKALPKRLTFKYFVHEFLNTYFSFDSKIFNTVRPLVFNPAFLSLEFIAGRRIRYINPIQLFVFSSFLFFLVNSIMILKEDTEKGFVTISDKGEKTSLDSLEVEDLDSLYVIKDGDQIDTLGNSYIGELLKRGQDFNSMDDTDQNEKISRSFSYAVFFLMPLFALYLRIFFRKRSLHYLENLIFSLHYHAFYFIIGTIILLFDRLLTGDLDTLLLLILAIFYLFIALKRFYSFSWMSTAYRFFGLVLFYGLSVSVVLLVTILLTLLI
jgi:ribosomal protein L32